MTNDQAMPAVLIEERMQIPANLHSLADFRRWACSADFPQRGRIDYLAGTIEVDMQAQAYYSHGGVLAEILRVLTQLIKQDDLGEIYFSDARIASVAADLSAEPDIVFLTHEVLDSGKVKLVSKANRDDDAIEVEGSPDMVAEVVSDSSVGKDTRRLPVAYFAAGVREYWLVDARGEDMQFTIHTRGEQAFEPTPLDADGYQASPVYARAFQLTRERNRRGNWKYDLLMK